VDALQQPEGREAGSPRVSSSGSPAGQSPSTTSTARYSSITNDNDRRSGVVGVVAAQQRVGREVGVERGLELIGEVASGDAPQDLAVAVGETRVPGAAPGAPRLTPDHSSARGG